MPLARRAVNIGPGLIDITMAGEGRWGEKQKERAMSQGVGLDLAEHP